MHLFHELFELSKDATLSMLITSDQASGTLTIIVLPRPRAALDQPALSKDLTLTGTPDEFAADFVALLTDYRSTRATLRQQAEAVHAALQTAQADSTKPAAQGTSKAGKPVARCTEPGKATTTAIPATPANPEIPADACAVPSTTRGAPPTVDTAEPDLSWCKNSQPQLF